MPSHLQKATIQAAILNVTSSVLAQIFKSYRKSGSSEATTSAVNPFDLDLVPITQFLIFCLLSTPPNFLFQQILEQKFPGYPMEKGKQKIKVDDGGKGVIIEKKLDVRNTAIKVLIDQTIGAAVNTIAFLAGIKAMRGGSFGDCIQDVRMEFWPIMIAGYKLWPLVSLLNFTLIPVEQRVVVGSLAGLGWGVFMALRASA